jgi:hypothetical protein
MEFKGGRVLLLFQRGGLHKTTLQEGGGVFLIPPPFFLPGPPLLRERIGSSYVRGKGF